MDCAPATSGRPAARRSPPARWATRSPPPPKPEDMPMGQKTPFLTVYDYGAGGVWAIVISPDKKSIKRKYPLLDVLDGRPMWMDDERYAKIVETDFYDIDD